MENNCCIPWKERLLPELTPKSKCTAKVIRNEIDRGEENLWSGKENDFIEYRFNENTETNRIRFIFDSDLNRDYHNMPCNYPLVQTQFKLPETLIKEYKIQGFSENGEIKEIHITDNHQQFVKHCINWCVKNIYFTPISTNGTKDFRLFNFEINHEKLFT